VSRRRGRAVGPALAAALLSWSAPPDVPAQTPAGPVVRRAAPPETPESRRGRLLYLQCRACHALRPDDAALAGPHLGDLIGRAAASVEGFGYSAALRATDFEWDRERLDEWLAAPGKMLPGNTMAFAGIVGAEDRAALIAYLETATRAAPVVP
jgi:cytochrome c